MSVFDDFYIDSSVDGKTTEAVDINCVWCMEIKTYEYTLNLNDAIRWASVHSLSCEGKNRND